MTDQNTAVKPPHTPQELAQYALKLAIASIGQGEQPPKSNWGPFVSKCLLGVGINFPAAWCQAFAHEMYAQAATALCMQNPVVKTGGVQACWNATTHKKLLPKDFLANPAIIKPGDQFIFHEANGGHTGIVEFVDVANKTIHTIEGNTNHDGSREGIDVERKVRSLSMPILIGIIQYS